MMTVDVRVLGPLEVVAAGGRLTGRDFPSKKARRLFEVLVLAEGQTVSKDALLDALWRREMPRNPQATVETAVSLARKALATVTDERVIVTEPSGYRIDTTTVDVDLARLDRAITMAEYAPPGERVRLLATGLDEVRGRLLEDQFATDWLLPRRERVARRIDLARVLLARSALDDGTYEIAYRAAEASWTASDVVLQDAYAVGVLALGALGRREEADRVFAIAVERLSRDGVPPGPVLFTAHERLRRPFGAMAHSGLLEVPSALVVDAASLGPAVPLLGREEERSRILSAAQAVANGGGVRWLHLSGGRGMGASHLLESAVEWTAVVLGPSSALLLPCAAGDGRQELLLARRVARSIGRPASNSVGPDVEHGGGAALFAAIVEGLTTRGPTVLVVDDLASADDASVAVLRAVATGGLDTAPPLLVLSAGGPAPVGSDEIRLHPLRAEDLEPLGPGPWWAVTGGHPLVVQSAVAAARGAGRMPPERVRDLSTLLDALDPLVGVVVGRTDYITGEFDIPRIAAELRIERSMVADALLRACDAGLVARDDMHMTFSMTSSLLREIISLRAGGVSAEDTDVSS